MSKKSLKPGALLGPVPTVMVSCGSVEDGTENIITIGWTGMINSEPPRTYVSVRPSRVSHPLIKESGEFVINLVPEDLAFAMDWCGCVSRSKAPKFGEHEEFTLTPEPCEKVSCPGIKESPVQLECKVFDVKKMESHDMFMAEIVNVRIDEEYINGEGRIAMERMGLVSLIHGSYYVNPSERIGRMGYSVMKDSTKKKVNAQQRAKQRVRKQGKEKFDKG